MIAIVPIDVGEKPPYWWYCDCGMELKTNRLPPASETCPKCSEVFAILPRISKKDYG